MLYFHDNILVNSEASQAYFRYMIYAVYITFAAAAQAMWMGQQNPLDMTDHKDPQSDFGKEVNRIKYNIMRALDEHASYMAEWNANWTHM